MARILTRWACSGMYCPYIGSYFLDQNDTQYFDLSGMLLYDAMIGDPAVQRNVGAPYHIDYWSNSMPLNKTTMDAIHEMGIKCGLNDYVDYYLTFPPSGIQPALPPGASGIQGDDCDLMYLLTEAILDVNPSWNIYQTAQLPPLLDDPLNIFWETDREPYPNRTDFKTAIHAPAEIHEWLGCSPLGSVFVGGIDHSDKPILHVLPRVIEDTQNVIISHGMNDFIFNANGTLLTIQNMTWGGRLGFQTQPKSPLFVPYQDGAPAIFPPDPNAADDDWYTHSPPSGVLGTTHTERGLTWNLVMSAGHMTPMFQPALAYRQVEVLLGRVRNMSSTVPFVISPNGTTEGGIPQPQWDELGDPVGPILGRPRP